MDTEYKIGQRFYDLTDEEYSKIAQYCNDNSGIYLSKEDGYFEIKKDDFIMTEEEYLYLLRQQRQNECFSKLDRSPLWYDTLTDSQKKELKEWYKSWLDVTETKVVPEKPSWL